MRDPFTSEEIPWPLKVISDSLIGEVVVVVLVAVTFSAAAWAMIPGTRQRTDVIPTRASFLDEMTDERFFFPNIFFSDGCDDKRTFCLSNSPSNLAYF